MEGRCYEEENAAATIAELRRAGEMGTSARPLSFYV